MNNTNLSTLDPAAPYGNPSLDSVPDMSEEDFDATINLAIKTFGEQHQTLKLFEEMAELQDALCKLPHGRATVDDVCQEIADVLIMCLQMARIYGDKRVERWANFKILRLADRLASVNTQSLCQDK